MDTIKIDAGIVKRITAILNGLARINRQCGMDRRRKEGRSNTLKRSCKVMISGALNEKGREKRGNS